MNPKVGVVVEAVVARSVVAVASREEVGKPRVVAAVRAKQLATRPKDNQTVAEPVEVALVMGSLNEAELAVG